MIHDPDGHDYQPFLLRIDNKADILSGTLSFERFDKPIGIINWFLIQ
jgi:hypothetical protein